MTTFDRLMQDPKFKDEFENGTIPGIQHKITKVIKDKGLLPDRDGNYKKPEDLKLPIPFRIAEFDIIYGLGISKVGCILDVATDMDIIKKAGAWFSYNDDKIGQGRDKAKEFLEENPEILAEVEAKVREKLTNKE